MHKYNNKKKKKTNVYILIYIDIIQKETNRNKVHAQLEIANNKIEIDQSRKILSSKNLYTWP